jgi:AcrR family transcriptional regulator
MVASTRERILDVAMELFGQQGFKATSVVQIEQAAGLASGSGGIYNHFRTKQALLEAGIERHLGRLDALRDIDGARRKCPEVLSESAQLTGWV